MNRSLLAIRVTGLTRCARLAKVVCFCTGLWLISLSSLLGQENSLNQASHLLLLANDDEKDAFVISTVPGADANDQSIKTRTVTAQQGLSNYRTLGVYGGHLFVLSPMAEVLAIDLKQGVKKQIAKAICQNAILVGGQLYFVAVTGMQKNKLTHALRVIHLRTGDQRDLCQLTCARSSMQSAHQHDFTLAANEDGTLVAVTELIPPAGQLSHQPKCRIVLVDGRTGEVTRTQPTFAGRLFLTGAGDQLLAPKLFWIDNQTLLIAADKAQESSELVTDIAALGMNSIKLFTYHVPTQATEEVCRLPNFTARKCDPWFSRTRDSQTLVHLRSLGAYRIDFAKKELREHNNQFGDYSLKQSKGQISLHYANHELERETELSRIFFSPDGQQVAWLPVGSRGGVVLQDHVVLKIHDRVRGVRSVLTSRFPWIDAGPQQHNNNVCLWLTESDLNPTDYLSKLKEAQTQQVIPRVDTRPEAKDSVAVTLKTNQKTYRLHEPIELTVTIKNLAKSPIRFESRLLKQQAQPFNDLRMTTERTSVEIRLLELGTIDSFGDYLEIPPGQSRDLTQLIESSDLGKHSLQIRFEDYSLWKGYLKVGTEFEVVTGNHDALLNEKFNRLMASALLEFKNEPRHAGNFRFQPLGAAGLPLLVEYLQKCEDGPFRRYLGKELSRIADKSTLPYLQQLLKTDLEFDGETVVEALWRIYCQEDFTSRPIPETTQLLIEAGQHRNVEVRRSAVKALRHSVNEAVDQFMQHATEDSDNQVASLAARYVAARQQLPLHRWLYQASRKMTPASLLAARSIVWQLEQNWHKQHGKIPDGTFAEVVEDQAKVAEYSATLKAWGLWCFTNQRSVETFFDKERDENTFWYGTVINRYASGSNTPIVLKPRVTHSIEE